MQFDGRHGPGGHFMIMGSFDRIATELPMIMEPFGPGGAPGVEGRSGVAGGG
jgi:hypothetical protein